MRTRSTTSYGARLCLMLLALLMLLAALPARAGAAEPDFRIQVDVRIPGGGTARITGCDYVEREDELQEMYASGWNDVNGSQLMPDVPSGALLPVPADTGEASFVWDLTLSELTPQNVYSYRITQEPGTDPLTWYDDNTYLLEIFIHEDGGKIIPTAVLRDDDAPGAERDRKPDSCVFVNAAFRPATDDPGVVKIVKGSPAKPSVFTFAMTPKDPSWPMPQGSKNGVREITVTGAGEEEFGVLSFSTPGIYEYTVLEKNTGEKGYTYDATSYTYRYEVTAGAGGVLSARRTILKDGVAITAIRAEFVNAYHEEQPVEPDPDKPRITGSDPRTGDFSHMALWTGLSALSLAALAVLVLHRVAGNPLTRPRRQGAAGKGSRESEK